MRAFPFSSFLLPLWEKVARIARCEPDEGYIAAEGRPLTRLVSLTLDSPPSPSGGEGISYAK
jgi:hypothetical protein